MKIKTDTMHPDIRDEQLKEFEIEIASFKRHREKSKQIIKDQMPKSAKVLILDVSQGAFIPKAVNDDGLCALVQEFQCGGGPINHGSAFRSLLGFDFDDERCVSWDVAAEPDKENLPNPKDIDAFIVTGGPAMPSELHPGNETKNTYWLQKSVQAMKTLAEHKVPGAVFCLGHQLWNHAMGAKVGRLKEVREFGTVSLKIQDQGKDLNLLKDMANEKGTFKVNSSHSEAVITPVDYDGMEVILSNDYSEFQGAAFPLTKGQNLQEADAQDQLVISIQNHPELMALCMEVLRRLRRDAIRNEGFDIDRMVFRNTPRARNIFLNFLEMVSRRAVNRVRQL